MIKQKQRLRVFLAAAFASILAACSSGSAQESPGSASPGAPGKATPILIGSLAPLSSPLFSIPNARDAAEAAVETVNAQGGVNGHPLSLTFCDTKLDKAQELSCARDLIAKQVVATVVPVIVQDQSGSELKLFDRAGIAYFGGQGVSPAEVTDANSYPLSSGAVGWIYGAIKVLKNAGAKKVLIFNDNSGPSEQYVAHLATEALAGLGVPSAGTITADVKADPTMSAAAAKVAASGADGVFMTASNIPLQAKALAQAGYKGFRSMLSSSAQDATLKALGELGDGILLSSQTALVGDTSNPAVAEFIADMKKYAPGADIDSHALEIFTAVRLLAKIMANVQGDKYDSAAFKAALDALDKPIDVGLIAPWYIKGRSQQLANYPRILNPTIAYGVIKNGKVTVDSSAFDNPFTP